jgi:hypothetical protein
VNELRDLPEVGELLLDRKGKHEYNSNDSGVNPRHEFGRTLRLKAQSNASAEEVAALKCRRR